MNFFEHQEVARRKTGLLVATFSVGVLAIVAIVVIVVGALIASDTGTMPGIQWYLENPGLVAGVSLVTVGIIGTASLVRTVSLRSGGGKVAMQLGGTPIGPDTTDPKRRRLINVVEEMAIASGVPMPDVYVLENDAGLNAFAAGTSIDDAVVAVTRGCLERLTRDELQGVIAHEFSHILNGDMRLNLKLVGVLFGLLALGLIGRTVLRSMHFRRIGSSKRDGGVAVVAAIGLALFILGYIGVFFGRLMKAAVSRQREYLADASAVQFTLTPRALPAR